MWVNSYQGITPLRSWAHDPQAGSGREHSPAAAPGRLKGWEEIIFIGSHPKTPTVHNIWPLQQIPQLHTKSWLKSSSVLQSWTQRGVCVLWLHWSSTDRLTLTERHWSLSYLLRVGLSEILHSWLVSRTCLRRKRILCVSPNRTRHWEVLLRGSKTKTD